MNVRSLYHTARGVQGFTAAERESTASRSLRRRLWLWRRGFVSQSDAVYDLEESTAQDYVSDYQRYVRTKKINGTWSVALSNKLLFHRVMQPFDDRRMTVYGMVRDGTYHSVDATESHLPLTDGGSSTTAAVGSGGEKAPETYDAGERVVDRLEDENRLVLKWAHGGGGHNVLLCVNTDDGYRVNGDEYTEAELRSLVADLDEYLVCEFVAQSSFSAVLYPSTPNTLRIITMYDEAAGEPFVAAAIQRIGTTRSAPLDNFTQGGLSAKIDLETGELGPGAQPPEGDRVGWHSTHPDTGTPVEGVRIPGWDRIRAGVLEMADACSFLPYIGWDVIVTGDDGEFSVIEANSYPGLKSIQVHGPLLTDDRVREFYERHGVC
ncbi:sugar-transfer associated ATP-grasp domain-containing protein [Natronorubrum halophilum]|uniref:sugar-transfer associated ATP-grasp domain-containing protein n=1 Tax=Natronorubrum halophilum TaxID=1702106 RepID=UPI000EF64671|nr:sugar-transfer associated ATP-grasp domain-containing protein [Natronorubrum halophilum]